MPIPRRVWTDYNGTPGSGTPINNAELQTIYDTFEFDWAFDSYIVSWTSTGTAPAIGNGTLAGHYMRIGDMMVVMVKIIMGSSTTYGTGNYAFNLPATASSAPLLGIALATNAGTANYTTAPAIISTTTFGCVVEGANTSWGPTLPFTWGSGDSMTFLVVYQKA